MRDIEEVPGSWLQIGTALAVAATWGVNHLMEDLPPVSPPLFISDFAIKNK